MAKTNYRPRAIRSLTKEGASVIIAGNEEKLRRTVLSCLLFEKNFYEDGQTVYHRISDLVKLVRPEFVAELAIEARNKYNLRHVSLCLIREAARYPTHRHVVADALVDVIQRADELSEFLAMYWTEYSEQQSYGWGSDKEIISTFKKTPIAASVKKGLARAFTKFDEYQLAKYNRKGVVNLRDVLFMCHAKPETGEQADIWAKLAAGELKTPDTWETKLSAGANKKEDFTRRLKANLDPNQKNLLGAMALLKNLRGMDEAGVDRNLIKRALKAVNPERVLPYRFITAARYAPWAETALEVAMLKCLSAQEVIPGHTVLLVDVSYSMNDKLSDRSEMTRLDAACGIAILAREVCEDVTIYTYNTSIREIASRRGFALRDAIGHPSGGTDTGGAVRHVNAHLKYDRMIIFTDEQSRTSVPDSTGRGYIANIACCQNGVGYNSKFVHVNGFSEATVDYIREYEKLSNTSD